MTGGRSSRRLLAAVFRYPTCAHGTDIDAAPEGRVAHRTPHKVCAGCCESDDDEGLCHGKVCRVPGKCVQYAEVSD
jgi:hypothetical protein